MTENENNKEVKINKEIQPTNSFKGICIEDFPKDYEIQNEKDLNFFLLNMKPEIKDLINLKSVNELLSDKNYNLKMLNKKLQEYLTLNNLFVFFKSDIKKNRYNTKEEEIYNQQESKEDKIEEKNKEGSNKSKKKIKRKQLKGNISNIKKDSKKELYDDKKEELNESKKEDNSEESKKNKKQNKNREVKNLNKTEELEENKKKSSELTMEESKDSIITINTNEDSPISFSSSSYFNKTPNKDNKNVILPADKFFQSNILPKLIEKDDEIIEGKEYEIKTRKYFKIFLDYCSEQELSIETNPSTSFDFLYNMAKDYDRLYKNEKSGNIVEFDILIKNINTSTIKNLIKAFKTNIIAYHGIDSLNDDKEYDIIGEVAKDFLNQAVEKKNQIKKYIDIIRIDKILRSQGKDEDILAKNFKSLNLGIKNDKILMIFTNGSYIKLKYAYNQTKKITNDINNNNNKLLCKNRDIKNTKVLESILFLLEEKNIPYIIFYISNDLTNNIDNTLISLIKKKADMKDQLLMQIISNEKKIQENMVQSYYINSITQLLKEVNMDLFKEIIKYLPDEDYLNKYLEIFDSIIEIKLSKILTSQLIFVSKNEIKENSNYTQIKKGRLDYFNYIEIFINNLDKESIRKNELLKKNKNIVNFLIFDDSVSEEEIGVFNLSNYKAFTSLNINESDSILEINKIMNEKYIRIIEEKIYRYISANILNYSNNKEFLCLANFIKKIVFDLKNINFIFYPKDVEYDSEILKKQKNDILLYNAYKLLKDSHIFYTKLKEKISQKFDDKAFNLKFTKENFKVSEDNFEKLYEHYLCIKLYFYFFTLKLKKHLKRYLMVYKNKN